MQQTLLTRLIEGESDRKAVLGIGQMSREFYDPNWSVIRIGLLVSFSGLITVKSTPRLVIGGMNISAGAGGYGEGAATRSFIGVRSKASQWDFNNITSPIYYTAGQFEIVSKTGTTIVSAAFATPQTAYFSADPLIRNAILLDMETNTGNGGVEMRLKMSYPITAAAARTDLDSEGFYSLVQDDVFPTGYGSTSQDLFIGAWSFLAPTTKPSALNIYWDKAIATCEISEVRIKSTP